jgi:hypothetical protein
MTSGKTKVDDHHYGETGLNDENEDKIKMMLVSM